MAYWGCAQLQPNRTAVALHHLALAGYEVYHPRLRQQRVGRGRRVLATPPLFPGYCFIQIELQWHTARWAPGVVRLVLDGVQPARFRSVGDTRDQFCGRDRELFCCSSRAPIIY